MFPLYQYKRNRYLCDWNDIINYQAETMADAVLALLNIKYKILFPFVWEFLGSTVISSQSVDSGFD